MDKKNDTIIVYNSSKNEIISREEISVRVIFLNEWIVKNQPFHFLYTLVRKEFEEYQNLLEHCKELHENEIFNQVKSQFYEMLKEER